MKIDKEVEIRIKSIDLDLDYENRMCDLAIETLSDILECDESTVYIKWMKVINRHVPVLYILFSGPITESMPKVHIDNNGNVHPAHAICLAKMPSGNLMITSEARYVIRKGVEEFLTKHCFSTSVKKG